jgi:hypothetical protein
MRDPNRIYKMQTLFTTLWAMKPDLRYFQIVDMVMRKVAQMDAHPHLIDDPFYVEDDKTEAAIEALIKESLP